MVAVLVGVAPAPPRAAAELLIISVCPLGS